MNIIIHLHAYLCVRRILLTNIQPYPYVRRTLNCCWLPLTHIQCTTPPYIQEDSELLTLGVHAQRRLRYIVVVSVCLCVCVSVCVCVCLSVKSHLTFGASVHPENTVTHSVGNESQKICSVFSDTALFQRYSTCCICTATVQSAISSLQNTHMHF